MEPSKVVVAEPVAVPASGHSLPSPSIRFNPKWTSKELIDNIRLLAKTDSIAASRLSVEASDYLHKLGPKHFAGNTLAWMKIEYTFRRAASTYNPVSTSLFEHAKALFAKIQVLEAENAKEGKKK